ncbi:Peptide chain release factor RF2 [Buchnera aphidicola (Tetraneura ulmi)]|uniref:peptide chain release factor 2 n=1 Tax=Buchnera aphidicola TaxID=9 RepID=UPI0034641711
MSESNSIRNKIIEINKKTKKLWRNLDYERKKEKLKIVLEKLNNIKNWNESKKIKKLYEKKIFLEKIIKPIQKIENSIKDIKFLFEITKDTSDFSMYKEIKIEILETEKKIQKVKKIHIFTKKNDNCNCYIDIQPGSGGIESQDWAQILLKMYLRWCELKKFKTKIIEQTMGEITGIKSTTIKIYGKFCFGWMRTESGIHRLVRKSPFDTGNRRHTSFCSIFVYPDIYKNEEIKINTSELRIDVYRSSGAGGQHVNRTESAVRITHLPTGIITQCQKSRSQHKNKEQALKQIKEKLYQLENKKEEIKKKNIENKKSNISWGQQIRSYVLDQSRIKDLRTGIETRKIDEILNGNLELFILSNLQLGL